MNAAPPEVRTGAYTVRHLARDEAPAMRALFTAVFGHALSAAFQAWKYRAPNGCSVGVFRDGELVAHYGGIGARIRLRGEPASAIQIVDVMVRPTERHAVRKQSPFFLGASYFLERYIGYTQPYLLGYGFPSDRHLHLAEHLGLYARVGTMVELSWRVPSAPRGVGLLHKLSVVDAANFAACEKALASLWRQLQADLRHGIVVCKDPGWLRWRYLECPDRNYLPLLLTHRLSGKPVGFIVLKEEADKVLLLDYLGPLANLPHLLAVALAQARALGKERLYIWCSETFADCFNLPGKEQQDLPIGTPANIWSPGPAPDTLRDQWWLMAGDSDYL